MYSTKGQPCASRSISSSVSVGSYTYVTWLDNFFFSGGAVAFFFFFLAIELDDLIFGGISCSVLSIIFLTE